MAQPEPSADVCTRPPATADEALGYVPPGPGREELARLVEMGRKFRGQQVGRRRGFLAKYLQGVHDAGRGGMTFDDFLDALDDASHLRARLGAKAGPVEKVDRVWCLMTYHAPGGQRVQVTFKTLQNHFTACRKISKSRAPGTA